MFGHISRMEKEDSRKLKTFLFGIVEGTNKRGRPCRGLTDDIVSGLFLVVSTSASDCLERLVSEMN